MVELLMGNLEVSHLPELHIFDIQNSQVITFVLYLEASNFLRIIHIVCVTFLFEGQRMLMLSPHYTLYM